MSAVKEKIDLVYIGCKRKKIRKSMLVIRIVDIDSIFVEGDDRKCKVKREIERRREWWR